MSKREVPWLEELFLEFNSRFDAELKNGGTGEDAFDRVQLSFHPLRPYTYESFRVKRSRWRAKIRESKRNPINK
jgi:hypothetical protein